MSISPGYQLQGTLKFTPHSPQNPSCWSLSRKIPIALVALFTVMNSGLSASLPSNAIPYLRPEFHLSDGPQTSLPTSLFLVGYTVGPLVFSPLSETVGRRLVLLSTFGVFVLSTLGCALAPNWPVLLVFRFLCGSMGSAPQTVVGGIYADLFEERRSRGRAMLLYMSASSFGPILGPIISGFASPHNWRWTFWIELIFAGCTFVGLVFVPETFAPVLLKREATRLRSQGLDVSLAQEKMDMVRILQRPLAMLVLEPIISCTALFIALAYSFVFFYLQAYPIIFGGVYHLSIQTTSLAFLPVGIGASSTAFSALAYDTYYERAKKAGQQWTNSPELHRLPISCIGGIGLTVSLLWLAWSSRPSIPWALPMSSGLLFGFAYQTIFISLLTYVTDAYTIYSASALASSVILRSLLGAVFPLAVRPMYNAWGVAWATSFVGLLSLLCVPIPFGLIAFGKRIRERSRYRCV
ncbi:MFS transporter [Aspergillus tanneri]|uniref:Major facilitator superfamily (MFS) profile domain-containing protein n=1 Tax=Aspergillus tanneri TaxID=1220188 RepID=A0A5M9N225_9EURO|nr:uncharacterized protein ATNIH1004_000596 [Aspergillus tanneri]KAA8651700.1 hypothetical protein ATNIH1004_000596 [Aspergillus tanneri]